MNSLQCRGCPRMSRGRKHVQCSLGNSASWTRCSRSCCQYPKRMLPCLLFHLIHQCSLGHWVNRESFTDIEIQWDHGHPYPFPKNTHTSNTCWLMLGKCCCLKTTLPFCGCTVVLFPSTNNICFLHLFFSTCHTKFTFEITDHSQNEVKCREVAQSWLTLCDSMYCSLPGSSIHGIFQARILEWVSISFSRESSRPRDWTWVSHIEGRLFAVQATKESHLKLPIIHRV